MDRSALRLSEVVAALSYALDVADGHDLGHAVRSCVIGMRLADEVGIPVEERSALFYGLLLKDLGCSSNAAKVAAIYGADDQPVKRDVKQIDHRSIPTALAHMWRSVGGTGPRKLANAVGATVRGPGLMRAMTTIRCERGAEIARMLELPPQTAEAIRCLDEHWDGGGHPAGLAGEEIPVLARILGIAQVVEVFHRLHGIEGACEVARARSGRWFDPALVAALERTRGDVAFWSALEGEDVESRVASLEPPDRLLTADEERLDRVAEGFALVIDAKSPYTFRHSERVSELAVGAGRVLGLDALAVRDLRRAGLLHDIGKLAVSNRILDKKGPLTAEEWSAVVRHPEYTAQILARIPRFEELAADAAAHHEKLDGSGYHRGLRAEELSAASRLLAVADIFEALTAERPYRAPLAEDEALGLMALDVGTKLCRDAFDALGAHVRSGVALSSAAA